MHQDVGTEADGQAGDDDDSEQRQVGDDDAQPFGFSRRLSGKTVGDEEHKARSQAKHHQWMAYQTVGESLPFGAGAILLHRHRPHIADAALVEVARCGVVDHVGVPPFLVGRKGEYAEDVAHNGVGPVGGEE